MERLKHVTLGAIVAMACTLSGPVSAVVCNDPTMTVQTNFFRAENWKAWLQENLRWKKGMLNDLAIAKARKAFDERMNGNLIARMTQNSTDLFNKDVMNQTRPAFDLCALVDFANSLKDIECSFGLGTEEFISKQSADEGVFINEVQRSTRDANRSYAEYRKYQQGDGTSLVNRADVYLTKPKLTAQEKEAGKEFTRHLVGYTPAVSPPQISGKPTQTQLRAWNSYQDYAARRSTLQAAAMYIQEDRSGRFDTIKNMVDTKSSPEAIQKILNGTQEKQVETQALGFIATNLSIGNKLALMAYEQDQMMLSVMAVTGAVELESSGR